MPQRVFLRIPLPYIEEADIPKEQVCFYLTCLSVFEWSTMVGKLSGIPRGGECWEHFSTPFWQGRILKVWLCSESLAHGEDKLQTSFYSVSLIFQLSTDNTCLCWNHPGRDAPRPLPPAHLNTAAWTSSNWHSTVKCKHLGSNFTA